MHDLRDGEKNYVVKSMTNRYNSVGGNHLTYDSAGNLTEEQVDYSYAYYYENRLTNWLQLVDHNIPRKDYDRICNSFNRGAPFGKTDWMELTPVKLKLQLTLKPRGKPKILSNTFNSLVCFPRLPREIFMQEEIKENTNNIEQIKHTTKWQVSFWGIRLTALTVVLVNVILYITIRGDYGSGDTIFKFSVIGAVYLMIIGGSLFPILMKSPADGMFVFVALSLVGCVAKLAVHADILEIYSAITALIIGPIGFMVFLIVLTRKR